MNTITTVIFDWGGVVINDPAPGLMRYCAQALGISEELYTQAHTQCGGPFQKGLISENQFWDTIGRHLNRAPVSTPSLWGKAFRAVYDPHAEVLELAARLQARGYKTALLSNTEKPAMDYFLQELKYTMFDARVFSCAEKCCKPEPAIYTLALKQLASQAQQSVFIDDNPAYLKGATRIGMHTILCQAPNSIVEGLEVLGVQTS